MNIIRWTAIVAVMFLAVSCSKGEDEVVLPETYEIVRGSNLFFATADLCGTVAQDEAGRGRWRRWMRSDERIASAPTRFNAQWGTVVVIQPGTYNVPRDLCASEAGIPTWLGLVLTLVALLVIGGTLIFRDRRRRRTERGRRFAHASAS